MPIFRHQKTMPFSLPSFQPPASSLQLAHCGGNSNRHTYEKLEVRLTATESVISLFLIDKKQHFSQGAFSAFPLALTERKPSQEPLVSLQPLLALATPAV
jgi:hypothetical protein